MDDSEFLARFEAGTIPMAQWNHCAHLRVAYLYVIQYSFEEALVRMRDGIRRFNAGHDVPDRLDSGYHETITQAWLRLVHVMAQRSGPFDTADAFLDANSYLCNKRLLRLFYSRERIMSAEAKAGFIEPDLTALPRIPAAGS